MSRKIAIVGKGPTARLAPFQDPSWEIWGLAWVQYPREDKTFDPHHPDCYLDNLDDVEIQKALRIARAKTLPIIGYSPNEFYANTLPFPFENIYQEFGRYLESSIAYMLAQAILEDPQEIGLWGVHLETKSEYFEQRANLEYLIGFGRGSGLHITVCPGAPLLASVWEAGSYGINNKHRFK